MINHVRRNAAATGGMPMNDAGFLSSWSNDLREVDAMMRCVGSAIEFW
jgi:hypothetical protein